MSSPVSLVDALSTSMGFKMTVHNLRYFGGSSGSNELLKKSYWEITVQNQHQRHQKNTHGHYSIVGIVDFEQIFVHMEGWH